jgi:hypothetical protein
MACNDTPEACTETRPVPGTRASELVGLIPHPTVRGNEAGSLASTVHRVSNEVSELVCSSQYPLESALTVCHAASSKDFVTTSACSLMSQLSENYMSLG